MKQRVLLIFMNFHCDKLFKNGFSAQPLKSEDTEICVYIINGQNNRNKA